MSAIFFYGLFMDRSLLAGKGLRPEVIGPAVLHEYRIQIGERATLLRSAGSRAYGIVMELADREARALYAEPSVGEYGPEPVRVELLSTGETVGATCYNLPSEAGLGGANPAYASGLARLAATLQFDPAYVAEIAAFATARLFAYGSLQPGGSNEHVLDGVGGEWEPASVRGRLADRGWGTHIGYPALILDDEAPEVPGHVLSSPGLPAAWERLDEFEGDEYERVVAPVTLRSGARVEAHLYVLRRR